MSDQNNVADLYKQVNELKDELYANRIQTEKTHSAASIRRKIARLYTIINSTNN